MSSISANRRQFERLQISEETIARDENGRKLGIVSHVGGGGMTIILDGEIGETFVAGTRLRVVVEEPSSGIRHTVSVEVKYRVDTDLGVEFVSAG